jgi:hypothetical protein
MRPSSRPDPGGRGFSWSRVGKTGLTLPWVSTAFLNWVYTSGSLSQERIEQGYMSGNLSQERIEQSYMSGNLSQASLTSYCSDYPGSEPALSSPISADYFLCHINKIK